jgi:phytoene/squalene synthetase
MKSTFDSVSLACSVRTTKSYSTSFSLGIRFLNSEIRDAIYSIYGFVRFSDEIVDTFHDYDKNALFQRFKEDTYLAIDQKISLNPILNSFQSAVNKYNIDREHIETFLYSMEMDLHEHEHDRASYETYILGSAEVVGLMCLKVFTKGDQKHYDELYPHARALGAAFQKINFLRDLHADFQQLGRAYFPGLDVKNFDEETKKAIEAEIELDFIEAHRGIARLPKDARLGVYVAYVYYFRLFKKIQSLPSSKVLQERIRINNKRKVALFIGSYVRHSFNMI